LPREKGEYRLIAEQRLKLLNILAIHEFRVWWGTPGGLGCLG
jgi:hypothetical protein